MKIKKIIFLMIVSSLLLSQFTYAQSLQTSRNTDWFQKARVGMIIHWGLYSIPAGEWNGRKIEFYGEWIKDRAAIPDSAYKKLAAQFNPQKFNANEWIRIANNAGMKYFCLVSKHHDGFTLWDTKQNDDWNIMDATPFKRDIVKELGDACKKQKMVYALYYSTGLDWHYPSSNWAAYKKYYFNQLKELLTNYGKIGYLWFDGEWTPEWNEKEAEELYSYVKKLQPGIITNNPKKKSSAGYGDFGLDEENYSPPAADFNTGLWERDRLVQVNTWGYKTWETWKKSSELIRDMIDAASLNMNFCINVGPKADGSFPDEAKAILNDFGHWLKINGEAIYNTNGFVKNTSIDTAIGRITRAAAKDSSVYVHIFNWPVVGQFIKIKTSLPVTGVVALDRSILMEKPIISTVNGLTEIVIRKPSKTDPFATVIKLNVTPKY